MGISYKDAGVDIDKGNEAVRLMKDHVKSTFTDGVLTEIGGFGGLFQLNTDNCPEPVLVSGTDGVGTKLKIAMLMDKHDTIGIDAVAMCVNDILVQGAAPFGGETAEMPDFYGIDEYDIAGFAVGVVDKKKIVDGSKTASGDVMLALPSTGVHSNGFSLVRKLIFDTAGHSVNDYVEVK